MDAFLKANKILTNNFGSQVFKSKLFISKKDVDVLAHGVFLDFRQYLLVIEQLEYENFVIGAFEFIACSDVWPPFHSQNYIFR